MDQLHMTSKWLACVYRSMDEFRDNQDLFDKLKSMKIIPLATCEYVSATESTIFFPLMSEDSSEKRPAYSFKGRDTPDNEVNSQVQKLLLKMGIKQLSPYDVINHHIIPILKSETWQTKKNFIYFKKDDKTRETLVSYVVYLKEQSEVQNVSINMDELRGFVRLVTNKGLKNPKDCAIHFTQLYGNEVDLPGILPATDILVKNGQKQMQKYDILTVFFPEIGLLKLWLCMYKDTPWAPLAEMWGTISEGSYIQDQSCSELHDLITQNKYPATYQEQMALLFQLLDKEWDEKYSRFQMCRLCDRDGRTVRDVDSSFCIYLRTLSWLPARQTEVVRESNGAVSWTETLTLMQPSCLYRNSPEVQAYLSHTVPYLEALISQSSTFCNFLGVKNSVSIDEIKKNLIKWSLREKPDIPTIFCALPSHIESVYKYLYENLPPKQLQELLHDNPIIFVPIPTNGVSYNPINAGHFSKVPNVIAGKMLSRNEVWWEDNTDLFSKYKNLLDEYHANIGKKHTLTNLYKQEFLKRMFLDGGRVSPEPSMAEYGELLVLMGSDLQLSERSVLVDALRLYAKIGQKLSQHEGADEQTSRMIMETNKKELLSLIKKKKIIVTKLQKWVGIDDHPMIPDNKEFEKIFEKKDGVHFIELEVVARARERKAKSKVLTRESEVNMEDVHKFLDLCNVKNLSECVTAQEITEMFSLVPKIQHYMHQVVPLIQRYLYTQHPEVYQEHIDINTKGLLQNVKFVQIILFQWNS
ncbi:hypothetical protein KUTeg_019140 [Tegillarca granosa]|uniref:Uncharacterized protein n=1 Tax=Tegillarca granosa TaxID=220873 RepID=A0ABQ9EDR4_TEGGR|nr:hypothetical protein KUTeg_019140 [Tegillarca granosa]